MPLAQAGAVQPRADHADPLDMVAMSAEEDRRIRFGVRRILAAYRAQGVLQEASHLRHIGHGMPSGLERKVTRRA